MAIAAATPGTGTGTGIGPAPANPETRRAWSEWAFLVPFAGRVLALQGMHPVVSQGLVDHSGVFDDPWGRGVQTIGLGLKLIYGNDPIGDATDIRALHRDIHGRRADGTRYHAWNPEPWAWVHLSTFEATQFARRAIGRAPSRAQAEAAYAEWREAGTHYGVREADMPADLDGLHAYVRHTIEHELVATETARRLLDGSRLPAPPVPGASLAWPLARPLAGHSSSTLLAGSFPSVLRRRLGVRWTPLHEAEYQSALVALRALVVALPDRLRMFPAAYDAAHAA